MLSAWLLSPVNKNIFVGSARASLDRRPGPNKRLPRSSKTEAAQFQTGEIKISAISAEETELHPDEGEEGKPGWQFRRVQVCVFTGGNAFLPPPKVILSVVSNKAGPTRTTSSLLGRTGPEWNPEAGAGSEILRLVVDGGTTATLVPGCDR